MFLEESRKTNMNERDLKDPLKYPDPTTTQALERYNTTHQPTVADSVVTTVFSKRVRQSQLKAKR